MSSSVFVESSSIPKTAADSLDEHSLASRITGNTSSVDSNLVVVYGKNGINFDRKGLENLIEEKTLSSISVIRITSPTPSMEDEEAEEAERQKEATRKNIGSDEEDINESENLTTDDERNSEDSVGDFESNIDECSSSNNDENTSDADNDTPTTARYKKKYEKKYTKTYTKEKSFKGRHNNERPEIVGLTVEEFYPPEDAKEMAKEILKLAGVSTIKHTADYEFQLFVIKNDHCYTPFTSPAQMKAKLAAEKLDVEKSKIAARKLLPQPFASVKQFITKKKLQQVDAPKATVSCKAEINDKEKNESYTRAEAKQKTADGSTENIEDDEEVITSASEEEEDLEESDITTTEISAESENDRDSDLDFDVNNRKVRKRKVQNVKVNRRSVPNKANSTKQNQRHSQEDENENVKSFGLEMDTITRTNHESISRPVGKSLITSNKMMANISLARKILPPPVETPTSVATAIKKQIVVDKTHTSLTQQTTLAASVRRGPIVQVGTPTTRNAQLSATSGKVPASPQSVKEIVINKVIASPKGGFTNIGALLAQSDIQTISSAPTTPTSSRSQSQQKSTPSSKGFMPLGIETAAKNQLPSQISIQTHQSSSELAAEHDKQLDLIDSIVKDEMEKSSIVEKAAGENENIPQLIKMLESTERALESKKTHPLSAFTASRAVDEDIDIANAPLLETPEDEIPADLLQHVVELIEDDKTLQEAVEQQVFGEDSNVTVNSNIQTPPPQMHTMFETQAEKSKPAATSIEKTTPTTSTPQDIPKQQTKSIIQATLFNEVLKTSLTSSTSVNVAPRVTLSASKTISILRKEPIQIVRGNGRVITLPPIEAPTTRAKRRAQAQPIQNVNLNDSLQSTINESLDTSLQSNTSFSTDSTGMTTALMVEKKSTETVAATRRRISKEGSGSAAAKTTKKVAAKRTAKAVMKHDAAEDASESQEDDDDPKKLWCICRQPHNNRFMICCDACEDWFHGTCVSITKAMGLEMEQKGIDWTCPKCVKKLEEKTQRKITDMLDFKKVGTSVPQQQQQQQFFANNTNASESFPEQISLTHKDINQALVDPIATIPKQNVMPKKQLIDIKKIQSGQFISIKNLAQKKLPMTVLTSGQKKQFLPLSPQTPFTKATIPHTQPKRVIVVQKLPAPPKSDAISKGIAVVKSPHQQQIKFHKIPVTTTSLSSGKSMTHAATVKAALEQHIEPTTPCIVCKKPARPNSIYCSDDCIRKHAQNALNAFTKPPESPPVSPYTKPGIDDKKKKSKGLFEDLLSMADRKPKIERVCVFERKSGKVLSGNNAPTTVSLKKWLQDNPTFEVVQPGSSQALEFEKKQKQRSSLPVKLSTSPSPSNSPVPDHSQTPAKKINLPHTHVGSDGHTKDAAIQPKALKQITEQIKSSPNAVRPATPKQLTKYTQQVSTKPDKSQTSDTKDETKSKEKSAAKRNAAESSNKKPVPIVNSNETSAGTSDSEPIRLNVRRTLKEQLVQRINEVISSSADCETDANKTPSTEYIEEFVKETEAEMYNYFNRDTGAKYKAKYRSLMFNIKDRKNQTLYQKICAKIITPKQLVRMSPEELASQELAQWRENEAKHQLEMIKKSELDLLSCAKNYVLKTHKGEEVIEGKSTDCVNLDITIPVEDVVAVLNNSTGVDGIEDKTPPPRRDYSYTDFDASKEVQSYHTETVHSTKDKERERERERERVKEKSHKNKDRHREKSKTRKRSRSRSRSREKRYKSSSHKDDKRDRENRDREKDRDRDKEHAREKERDRSRDEHDKRSADKKASSTHSPLAVKSTPSTTKDKHKESATHSQTQSKKDSVAVKSMERFSLIDQILESTKTVEEAANLPTDKNKLDYNYPTNSKPTQSIGNLSTTSSSVQLTSQNSTDSDQEPTSTVSITSSPQDPYVAYCNSETTTTLWSGNINMIDVASFQIVVQPVIGNAVNLGKLLLEELDVVGRIGPDTVWDYISKIKKSPNKEIVILRLLPAFESETGAYTILYKYLHKRNRLGVIKTNSSQIKDFYIFPLGAGNSLPPVLQPSERLEFFEDPFRPDVLLGIVIRVIGKRLSSVAAVQSTTKSSKFQSKLKSSDTFTPPGSPKRKRLVSTVPKDDIDVDAIIKAPIVAKKAITPVVPTSTTIDDQDEPYSPGCSSDDDLPLLTVKATEFHKTAEEELKRKMDDLNRQIAAQEMEIAGLLNVEPSNFISSSGTGTATVLNPSLASISIPSNLSQILASIKNIPEPPPQNTVQATHPSAVPPPPLIGSLHRSQKNDGDEDYNPEQAIDDAYIDGSHKTQKSSTSRLAQLSEAELLSMVPDDMLNPASSPALPPAAKKPRFDEPPPPGV